MALGLASDAKAVTAAYIGDRILPNECVHIFGIEGTTGGPDGEKSKDRDTGDFRKARGSSHTDVGRLNGLVSRLKPVESHESETSYVDQVWPEHVGVRQHEHVIAFRLFEAPARNV